LPANSPELLKGVKLGQVLGCERLLTSTVVWWLLELNRCLPTAGSWPGREVGRAKAGGSNSGLPCCEIAPLVRNMSHCLATDSVFLAESNDPCSLTSLLPRSTNFVCPPATPDTCAKLPELLQVLWFQLVPLAWQHVDHL